MPLPLENAVPTPNTIIVRDIVVTTDVIEGQLKTSALVILQAATFADSVWTPVGEEKRVTLDDVENLDADLVSLQSSVNTAMYNIITVIGAVNSIRKIL